MSYKIYVNFILLPLWKRVNTINIHIYLSFIVAQLLKVRAELAGLNHCAVPPLSRATTNLCWYYSISYIPAIYHNMRYGKLLCDDIFHII